jgi:hypothetical protein
MLALQELVFVQRTSLDGARRIDLRLDPETMGMSSTGDSSFSTSLAAGWRCEQAFPRALA